VWVDDVLSVRSPHSDAQTIFMNNLTSGMLNYVDKGESNQFIGVTIDHNWENNTIRLGDNI
jgi:hypothetical protein